MGKQLKLTKKEQKTITNAIMEINQILFLKMDDGVESPTLEGTVNVDKEDKKATFSFVVQKK